MQVCSCGDDALGPDGAVHHPSPKATGGRDFCRDGDQRVRPARLPPKIVA